MWTFYFLSREQVIWRCRLRLCGCSGTFSRYFNKCFTWLINNKSNWARQTKPYISVYCGLRPVMCFPSYPRSSDVNSDRIADLKKKKKHRRQRNVEAKQKSTEAAQRLKNSGSCKQSYDETEDDTHNGFPQKRQRTAYTDPRIDHLNPSQPISATNGSTHHHLNGHTGIAGAFTYKPHYSWIKCCFVSV